MPSQLNPQLRTIKVVHSVVWLFFVLCIFAIALTAAAGRFEVSAVASAFVLLECGILACNGGRCPLTGAAARYTSDRESNFDIYLPRWLARHNKVVFGSLFVAGEVFALWRWWGR
jgi:hypothetical protein